MAVIKSVKSNQYRLTRQVNKMMKQMGNALIARHRTSKNAENFGCGVKRLKHTCHMAVAFVAEYTYKQQQKVYIYIHIFKVMLSVLWTKWKAQDIKVIFILIFVKYKINALLGKLLKLWLLKFLKIYYFWYKIHCVQCANSYLLGKARIFKVQIETIVLQIKLQ